MSPYYQGTYNVKVASIFGINTAVYWDELLNVYARVIQKKYDEMISNTGLFDLDRDYISKRTSLTLAEQLVCDKILEKAEIISYDGKNENRIRIDLERMQNILTEDDPEALAAIVKKVRAKKTDETTAKRAGMVTNFKNMIVETDTELLNAYFTWIETIILDKKDFLNRTIIDTFVKTIRSYSANKQVQLAIIEQAIIGGYKNAAFAYDIYKKHYQGNGTRIGVQQKQGGGIDTNSGF